MGRARGKRAPRKPAKKRVLTKEKRAELREHVRRTEVGGDKLRKARGAGHANLRKPVMPEAGRKKRGRPAAVDVKGLAGYEALKERSRARRAELSQTGRDIGELPGVVDPERKERARLDFGFFCKTYFPLTFRRPWSPDHLRVIAKLQRAVLEGGLFAMAMPRGSGKTVLTERASLWVIYYGHRLFVAFIGSEEESSTTSLDTLKTETEGNELLLQDFPEVVYPVRCLEGIPHRANGQLYQGERTHITWRERVIIFPTIPGSAASGAIVKVAGITGRVRGMKHIRWRGEDIRPSFVVVDDPQTDESAYSESQCAKRTRILMGAILNLSGPGEKISGIMPCTVIRKGDVADRILDRDEHPEWQGERMKLVYEFPKNERLWDRYAKVRAEGLRTEKGLAPATEFYREHRAEMDKGAVVAWPEWFDSDELSGIQHAMNVRLLDEGAFWAEFQNEPLTLQDEVEKLSVEDVLRKFNGRRRGTVASECSKLTAFVDVHDKVLFWAVCAWEPNFTGYVVDYGTHPDQRRTQFTTRTLARELEVTADKDAAICGGLEHIFKVLLGSMYMRDDGVAMRVDRLLVDKSYKPNAIETAVRRVDSNIIRMARGRAVTAATRPFAEYTHKPGQQLGNHWMVPSLKGTQRGTLRYVQVDVNFWKSFVHAHLAMAPGAVGGLSLYGDRRVDHRLFAEHLVKSEGWRLITDNASGRVVAEWHQYPSKPDNHWLDCLVGCTAAASMEGIAVEGERAAAVRRQMPVYRIPRPR